MATFVNISPRRQFKHVAVFNDHFIPTDAAIGGLCVQLNLGRNDPLLVGHGNQPHERLVVPAFNGGRSHLDLFDQLFLIGVDGIQPIDHVMLVGVGGRITEGTERVHSLEGVLATPFQTAVDALRFIHNDDGQGCPDQADGLLTAGLFTVLIEVVHVLLVDGPDGDHHDLNVWAGCEVADLPQLRGVVEEILEGSVGVQTSEVILGDLKGLVDSLLDGDRRHDDDELGETVALVQLKNCPQVDVGFAGSSFHLNGEVACCQRIGGSQPVAELDVVQVPQQFVVQQLQAVADAECRFRQGQPALYPCFNMVGDREVGPAGFLSPEQVDDRLNGGVLIVQVGLEVQLHGLSPPFRYLANASSKSER